MHFWQNVSVKLSYLLIIQILCVKRRKMRLEQRYEMPFLVNYLLCVSRAVTLDYQHIICIPLANRVVKFFCTIH